MSSSAPAPDRTLRRLRSLQPTPDWIVTILQVLRHPAIWIGFMVIGLFKAAHLDPWNLLVCGAILAPAVFVMFRIVKRIHRDIEPDTLAWPSQAQADPDIQQAIARVTANGGVLRHCHRAVIDAYLAAHAFIPQTRDAQ